MLENEDLEAAEGPGRPLTEYLEVPFRYPRHFLVPMVVVMIAAIAAVFVFPRKYRSATLILVENDKLPERFVTPMTQGIEARLETIRQVVLSRTRLEKVIEELNPYPDAVAQPSHVVVERMREAIAIRVQGHDSFSIEYVNVDPEKAMRVTDMLAQQFIADSARLREELTQRAYGFIQSNLDSAREELEAREEALRKHKQLYWGSLPEQLESNLAVLQQLQFEQQTLGNNLRTLEERRATLERSLLEARRLTSAGGSDSPAAELARLKNELSALRDRYTDEHPDVKAVLIRIQRLEERLADPDQQIDDTGPVAPEVMSLNSSLELVEGEIDSLNERRRQLDGRIDEFQKRVERTPRAEQQLAALTRDYQQLKENYDEMLRKEMDAQMARRMEEYWSGDYFRVLDPAYFPRRPIHPYGQLFVIAGIVLGMATGLVASFAADFLDSSVKSERELEALLALPILASVPHSREASP